MDLAATLTRLAKVVIEEAQRNPEFSRRLHGVLAPSAPPPEASSVRARSAASKTRRPANRRPPAVLDPIALAGHGEDALRTALQSLTLDQLKDIVADFGMDREKLVMKWKSPDRVIDRIVKISVSRAHKGDAFRS